MISFFQLDTDMLNISDNVLKYIIHASALENLETLIFTYINVSF